MEKKTNINEFMDKLEQRNSEAIKKKFELIKKIKVWLRREISDVHSNPNDDDVDSRELGILDGRYECARGLITQIKKWENEDDW